MPEQNPEVRRKREDFSPPEGTYKCLVRGVYGYDDRKGRPKVGVKVRFVDERFPHISGKEAFWDGWLHTAKSRDFTFKTLSQLLEASGKAFDPLSPDAATQFAERVANGDFLDVKCTTSWETEQWDDGSFHVKCRWINADRPEGAVSKKHGDFFVNVAERIKVSGLDATLGGDSAAEETDTEVPF